MDLLRQAGILALLSLMVAIVPMGIGILYAFRPTEARLALMRPLSLAGLFAGLCGVSTGIVNMLRYVSMHGSANVRFEAMSAGLAEAMVTLVVAFGSLTVGWLCVALGMHRQN
jgi:hypothetical protein